MKRLSARDRALLAVVFAIWAGCFALHVQRLASGRIGWVPAAFSNPAPGEAPLVKEVWRDAAAEPAAPRAGDRVLASGETSAIGAHRALLIAQLFAAADEHFRVPLTVERDGVPRSAALALDPIPLPWRTAVLSAAFASLGLLAFRRAARAALLGSVGYALHWHAFPGDGEAHNQVAFVTLLVVPSIVGVACVRVLLLFPEEVAV